MRMIVLPVVLHYRSTSHLSDAIDLRAMYSNVLYEQNKATSVNEIEKLLLLYLFVSMSYHPY